MRYLDKVNTVHSYGDFFRFNENWMKESDKLNIKNFVGTKHLFIVHNVSFNQIQSNGQVIPLRKITNKNKV